MDDCSLFKISEVEDSSDQGDNKSDSPYNRADIGRIMKSTKITLYEVQKIINL